MPADVKGQATTPEEVKVEELLEKATQQIKEIDDRINNPDKYMQPTLKPSWMGRSVPTGAEKEHFKKTQEYYRKDFKEQTRNQAAKLVEKSSLDVQLNSFVKVDNWAAYHTTEKEKLDELQGPDKKDLSKSQDSAMHLLQEEKSETSGSNSYKPSYLKPNKGEESNAPGGGKDEKTLDIEPHLDE